jgi:trans-AT polyketide synthase/acyltransferase/oxidoreductase domain-containing protein
LIDPKLPTLIDELDVNRQRMTKISLFPGQGSQKKGMGAELFKQFPEYVASADQELGYSIAELCLDDSTGRLDQTQFTQPALYVVSCLAHLKEKQDAGLPDYVAGHSVGEYGALFAAGAFDFVTGLKLVKKRGELMSKAKDGGMAAVIGMDRDRVAEVIKSINFKNVYIANLNTPQQIVISGARDSIVAAQGAFEASGAQLYIPLKVSGAFHSPFMSQAMEVFSIFLDQFEFSGIKIPTISNVTALPYKDDEIRENLALQITHSVLWSDSIRWLLNQPNPEFREIGPGKVLTGMLAKIKNSR